MSAYNGTAGRMHGFACRNVECALYRDLFTYYMPCPACHKPRKPAWASIGPIHFQEESHEQPTPD